MKRIYKIQNQIENQKGLKVFNSNQKENYSKSSLEEESKNLFFFSKSEIQEFHYNMIIFAKSIITFIKCGSYKQGLNDHSATESSHPITTKKLISYLIPSPKGQKNIQEKIDQINIKNKRVLIKNQNGEDQKEAKIIGHIITNVLNTHYYPQISNAHKERQKKLKLIAKNPTHKSQLKNIRYVRSRKNQKNQNKS